MLSKTSRYGVRAILYIAVNTTASNLMGVKKIAQGTNISKPTLSKILQELTKRGLVESKKGRNGGFYMTDSQKGLELMDVIKELEQSDYIITDCMLGQHNCNACDQCPYHRMVASIRSELKTIYASDTILETGLKLQNIHLYNHKNNLQKVNNSFYEK